MRTLKCYAIAFTIAAASSAYAQYYVPEVTTAGAVTVDGNLSEWSGATWIAMDKVYYGLPAADLTNAMWAARWSDAANLIYVAVKGTDTFHVFSDKYYSSTTADDVEVYLDASNSDSQTFKSNTWNKAQQYVAGANPPSTPWITLAGNNLQPGTISAYAATVVGDVIQYEFALKPFDVYNLFSPGSSTLVDLHGGSIVGLDVTMGTKQSDGSFTALCENLDTAKHRDARKFKDVLLVDGTIHINPVHTYTFKGNCNDSVGSAHGMLVNNTGLSQYTTVNGQTRLVLGNNGIQSNRPGEGDYIQLPAGIISGMGTPGFTLEFWLTFGSPAPIQNYFTFGTDFAEGNPDSSMWMTGLRNRWNDRSAFHWNINGAGTLYYCSRTGADSDLLVYPLNQEVQLVLTYDAFARTSKMYLHGKQFTSYTTTNAGEWPSPTTLADANNWLGRAFTDQDRAFEGSFNELRVYDRALLGSEIWTRWNEGPISSGTVQPLVIENPVHLYTFNEQANPGKDSVGTAHATMVNKTGNSHWEQKTGPNNQNNGYWVLGTTGADLASSPKNGPEEAANGDYIKLPAELIPNIGSQNLTFEIWMNLNQEVQNWMWDCSMFSFGQDGTRLSPPDSGAAPGYHLFLYNRNMDDDDNWDHRWMFGWNSGVNEWGWLDVMYSRFSRPNFPMQEIQYVATYDYVAKRSEVYMNGVFVGGFSTADAYKWVDLTTEWVGQNFDNWLGRGFNDNVPMIGYTYDEFRIYNRILNDKEIAQRYADGPVSMDPPAPTCGTPAVDLNKDGKVNSTDIDLFKGCAYGPGIARDPSFQCGCADVNSDGFLDMQDFAQLQRCLNNGSFPLAPGCGS